MLVAGKDHNFVKIPEEHSITMTFDTTGDLYHMLDHLRKTDLGIRFTLSYTDTEKVSPKF